MVSFFPGFVPPKSPLNVLVVLVTFPQGSGFNKHSKVHSSRAFTSSALGNTASAAKKQTPYRPYLAMGHIPQNDQSDTQFAGGPWGYQQLESS